MREKIIQFVSFTLYVSLLNILFHLIGVLFVDDYYHWYASKLRIENIFPIAIYAFLQIIVFPINKRYRIILVSWFYLTIGLILTHNDATGMGSEIWSDMVTSISKCNHIFLISFLNNDFLRQCGFFFLFALYLLFTGYSYKWFYKIISRQISFYDKQVK